LIKRQPTKLAFEGFIVILYSLYSFNGPWTHFSEGNRYFMSFSGM